MASAPPRLSPLWPGVPLALGSALLFGAVTPASKALLDGLGPQMLAGLLYLGAGLGLGLVLAGRAALGRPGAEAPLRRRDLPWLAGAILAGGVAGPLLLLLGLARTDAASAALLLNLEGLATMAIAWTLGRENVDRRLLIGAGAILAGAVAVSWRGGPRLDAGGALVALACLAWGIDNNLTRRLAAADPVRIAALKGLAAGSLNLALAVALGAGAPGAGAAAAAGVVGFLGVGVSLVLFILALRHLGAARTGAYFSLAPFLGAGLAVVALGEPVAARLVVGALLMALGLWLHLTERHDHEHAHVALTHEHAHVHDAHHRHGHPAGSAPRSPMTEPHSHPHRHEPLTHRHPHYPDLHHGHAHGDDQGHAQGPGPAGDPGHRHDHAGS